MPATQRYKCAFCEFNCLSKQLMKKHTYEYHEHKVCILVNKEPYKLHEVDKPKEEIDGSKEEQKA